MIGRFSAVLCATVISATAQNEPVIRVNTRLVDVDVVVRDKNGPVQGLTKNDFTVLDRGKAQTIATFGIRSSKHSSFPAVPLPAGTVANRLTSRGEEAGGATVVLWDMLNTETQDQAYVRQQVLKFLRTATEADPVALYALVKNVRVIQDFTDDPARLIRAVTAATPEQSANLTAPDLTDLASQINNPILTMLGGGASLADLQTAGENAAADMTDFALRDRVYVTANTLTAIAEHLAGLPGRKKLIWVSSSFPGVTLDQRSRVGASQIEIQRFGAQIDAAIRKLNEGNVAVYPIDPRGLTTGDGKPGTGGLMNTGIETMLLFADNTGGKAIYAVNDLVAAMHTVMEDDQITYTLGFYPSDQNQDGTYHTLGVKVAKKGVDVRHREGYYASDESVAKVNPGNRREAITGVFANPLDATQIGLRGSANPVPDRPGVYRLAITVNTNELHLDHVKDRWVGWLSFATLFSPSDSTKGSFETLRLSLTENRLRTALANGYTFSRDVAAGDAAGELRVVIQDFTTGSAGSLRVPLGKK
jgi:VWFA-related protein